MNSQHGDHYSIQLSNPALRADDASTHLFHFRPYNIEKSFFYKESKTRAEVTKMQKDRYADRMRKSKKGNKQQLDEKRGNNPRSGGGASSSGKGKQRGTANSSSRAAYPDYHAGPPQATYPHGYHHQVVESRYEYDPRAPGARHHRAMPAHPQIESYGQASRGHYGVDPGHGMPPSSRATRDAPRDYFESSYRRAPGSRGHQPSPSTVDQYGRLIRDTERMRLR